MTSPVDAALIASRTYKPQKAGGESRPDTPVRDASTPPASAAAVGRRGQPAVSLSLSAEALQVLSGSHGTERRTTSHEFDESGAPIARSEAPAPAGDIFEPLADDVPMRAEAPPPPPQSDTARLQLPGSRLDIKI